MPVEAFAQEILSGKRGTDGHVLTVERCPSDQALEVQLTLFNSIPYKISLTRNYIGRALAKGHHFSHDTGEASELKTMYVGF